MRGSRIECASLIKQSLREAAEEDGYLCNAAGYHYTQVSVYKCNRNIHHISVPIDKISHQEVVVNCAYTQTANGVRMTDTWEAN